LILATCAAGRAAAQPGAAPGASAAHPLATDDDARDHVRGCPVGMDCTMSELEAGLREFELSAFPPPADSPWTDGGAAPARTRSRRAATPTELRPDLPWLAKLNMPDLPVRWDERIIKYLEFYKDDPRGRNIMGAWLRDQGRYRDLILRALRGAHLPEDLLYVCMIESSYDPHDTSWAGALGLWQFMPAGARIYGLHIDRWIDERKDPVRSTQAVLLYWTDLYQRFRNWDLALAAFNAGYAAVLRSIAKYNTNDYWALLDYENGLPWGSSIYVPKALAAAIVGHNRALFGYDGIAEAAPFAYDEVTVPRSVSLLYVARAAGAKLDDVKALNPQLKRGRTPPAIRDYVLRVPPGHGAQFTERLERMRSEWDVNDEYRVAAGERFEDIATVHGISRRALAELNGVTDESEVEPGDILLVPRVSAAQKQANRERAERALYTSGHPASVDGEPLLVPVPDRNFAVSGKRRVFYRVVTGDSLIRVARSFGVTAADLAGWNGIDADGLLYPRMVLEVFVDRGFDPAAHNVALLDESRLLVVDRGSPEHLTEAERRMGRQRLVVTARGGETLAQVASRYGLEDHDLARINRVPRNTVLAQGQEVVVYKVVEPGRSHRAAEQQAVIDKAAARARRAREKEEATRKAAAAADKGDHADKAGTSGKADQAGGKKRDGAGSARAKPSDAPKARKAGAPPRKR